MQKLRRLQRHLDDGLPAPDTAPSVSQLITLWYSDALRHQVAISASDNYRAIAQNHIAPTLGSKRVANLTVADVGRMISDKRDSGLSVSTVRRIRSVLAQALEQDDCRCVWSNSGPRP